MTILITLCFSILSATEGARILAVFPIPSISHQVVFRPLTQELVRRGHEVIVITTDPAFPKGQAPENLTEIDVHDVSYKAWNDHFLAVTARAQKDALTGQVNALTTMIIKLIELQFQNEEVKKLIEDKTKNFDLIMLESCVKSALIYSHIFKGASVIQVSSFGAIFHNYNTVGAPTHPLLYPMTTRQRLTNLTIWEKITELFNHYYYYKLHDDVDTVIDEMFKRLLGPDVPSIAKLHENVDMLFLNIHPIFEGIRPVPPSVVYMGGLHQKPEKELPADLKSYMDSSKNGVIYISFGTNVDPAKLPAEMIQYFVRVFSKLPYDVLWKWSTDELPGRTKNIRISKWLPQSDLLRHPNLKLFITQGGLQSTDEAISAGVPLIGIPMLADQWFNVERYIQLGIGVKLATETLSEANIKTAIETVIENESYRRNVVKLRDLMNDQPQRPLERVVWWTEHVLRHGGAEHLRAPAANMSWTEYLELELVLTISLAIVITGSVAIISLCYLYTKLRSFSKQKRA